MTYLNTPGDIVGRSSYTHNVAIFCSFHLSHYLQAKIGFGLKCFTFSSSFHCPNGFSFLRKKDIIHTACLKKSTEMLILELTLDPFHNLYRLRFIPLDCTLEPCMCISITYAKLLLYLCQGLAYYLQSKDIMYI